MKKNRSKTTSSLIAHTSYLKRKSFTLIELLMRSSMSVKLTLLVFLFPCLFFMFSSVFLCKIFKFFPEILQC